MTDSPAADARPLPLRPPRPHRRLPPIAALDRRVHRRDRSRWRKVLTAERVPNSKNCIKLSVRYLAQKKRGQSSQGSPRRPSRHPAGRPALSRHRRQTLKPAKLMGIESKMTLVLAASDDQGRPTLIGFEQPPAPESAAACASMPWSLSTRRCPSRRRRVRGGLDAVASRAIEAGVPTALCILSADEQVRTRAGRRQPGRRRACQRHPSAQGSCSPGAWPTQAESSAAAIAASAAVVGEMGTTTTTISRRATSARGIRRAGGSRPR